MMKLLNTKIEATSANNSTHYLTVKIDLMDEATHFADIVQLDDF